MKYLIALAIGVCLLLSPAPGMADQAEDEAAIREVIGQLRAAFSDHDVQGMAALWDQSMERWDGSREGAAVAEFFADLFTRQPSVKGGHFEELSIVFVTADVAIYRARMENTGRVDEDGKPLPQSKFLGAWVLVKRSGKWLAAALFTQRIEE